MRRAIPILTALAMSVIALTAQAHGPQFEILQSVAPEQQVTAIHYCGDTYWVTTAAGDLPPFWEFNLRFSVNSSTSGPAAGHPAILPSGMLGDRAIVVVADPVEISALIELQC